MVLKIVLLIQALASQQPNIDDSVAALREFYGVPEEAEIMDKRDAGAIVIRAKPRYIDRESQLVGELGPYRELHLRLKVNGRVCTDLWQIGGRGRPLLDYRKAHRFLLTPDGHPTEENGVSCNVARVWLGDKLVFSENGNGSK